tara:strand:- start:824 stop:1240 length:417 start_codon:yes stop_codon:yes gene_type:complete
MSKSVEECVYHELSTSVALSSAVGNRISPAARPSTYVLPCVVYEVGAKSGTPTLSSGSTMISGDITVAAFADSVNGTIAPANAIRTALDNVSGTLDGTSYSFRFIEANPVHEMNPDGDDFGIYSQEIRFTYFSDIEDF